MTYHTVITMSYGPIHVHVCPRYPIESYGVLCAIIHNVDDKWEGELCRQKDVIPCLPTIVEC